jgi:hypothetical protein
MRVRFTGDYNYRDGTDTIAFKEGMDLTVAKAVGQAAIKARRAIEEKPEPEKGGD